MKIFVSYTLRDGLLDATLLAALDARLSSFGTPYIDILHNVSRDPQRQVLIELQSSSALCVCLTPGFLSSNWVQLELAIARHRAIPVFTIDPFSGVVPVACSRITNDKTALARCIGKVETQFG
jgi:hypothetical protein